MGIRDFIIEDKYHDFNWFLLKELIIKIPNIEKGQFYLIS